MTKIPALTLVLSNSGSLQNGLLALLRTIPQINPVLAEEELSTALRLAESRQPALAILDMPIPEVKEVIRQIKELCPQIHLIVLVNNVKGQKDAEELGVDSVLLKGFSAQKLVDIVEKLIDQRGSTSPNQINKKGGTNAD
jgi:DNA-binding NarL/FixJ family response regulator